MSAKRFLHTISSMSFQKIIMECTEKEGYDYANLLL